MVVARIVIAVEVLGDGRMQIREQHERVLPHRTIIDRCKVSPVGTPGETAGVFRLVAGQMVGDLLRTPLLPWVPREAPERVN